MGNYTIFEMFENPRRGRQARNFTTSVPKILDLESSSEQIFSENCRWVPLTTGNNMQQGVQTGGRNLTVGKGYVYTMLDISSCRHEKLSRIAWTATATCLHCTKVWHKTHPICDAPLSRSAWCSFAPLQKSGQSYRCYVLTEALSRMIFVPAQKLSGILRT